MTTLLLIILAAIWLGVIPVIYLDALQTSSINRAFGWPSRIRRGDHLAIWLWPLVLVALLAGAAASPAGRRTRR